MVFGRLRYVSKKIDENFSKDTKKKRRKDLTRQKIIVILLRNQSTNPKTQHTMKTIEKAIQSRFSTKDRYGNINAIWYENGEKHTDTVVVDNKIDRNYYYNAVRKAYDKLIASAPQQNQEKLTAMVERYLEDTFTEDAYMISVAMNTSDPRGMASALKNYINL